MFNSFGVSIERMLGYKDSAFTLEKSMEIIHPNYRDFVVTYGLMAYRMLREPRYRPLSICAVVFKTQ